MSWNELYCFSYCFRVAARALLFENASSPQSVPVGRCCKNITPFTTVVLLIPLSSPQICHDIACFCCLYRDAKAMYSCEAEHSHELSFPQGAHFSNGEQSQYKANIISFSWQLVCCSSAHNSTHACLRRLIGHLNSVHRQSGVYWHHTARTWLIPSVMWRHKIIYLLA